MTEKWRPVVGFEGAYEVSDLGRVRSLRRQVTQRTRWGGEMLRWFPEKILVPRVCGRYLAHILYSEERKRTVLAHILVAEAFLGRRPEGHEVCHYDDNGTNNSLQNLRYDTPKANTQDAIRNGRRLPRAQ